MLLSLPWRVNVEGTRNLLDSLSNVRPKTVLFASSAAVYADRMGPIGEQSAVAPVDLYGKTKVVGEQLFARFGAETGTRCVIARLFNVIGERETNPHVVPEIVEQLRQGVTRLRLGNLHTRRDYTDVVDVAEALERLLRCARPSRRQRGIGKWGLRGRARLGLRTNPRSEGHRDDGSSAVRTRDRESWSRTQAATSHTGWSPKRSLEETLRRLLLELSRGCQAIRLNCTTNCAKLRRIDERLPLGRREALRRRLLAMRPPGWARFVGRRLSATTGAVIAERRLIATTSNAFSNASDRPSAVAF